MNYLSQKQRFITNFSFCNVQIENSLLSTIQSAQWKFITSISMINNKINSQTARIIANLYLNYLKTLDLSHNPIGNKGLSFICKANMPSLNYLYLRGINTTEDSLKCVKKLICTKLQLIYFESHHWASSKMVGTLAMLNCSKIVISPSFWPN